MTGPEHYKVAEQLLGDVTGIDTNGSHVITADSERGRAMLAAAQVHATLATAAATALNDADGGMGATDHEAWREAASGNPPAAAFSMRTGPEYRPEDADLFVPDN